jgi:hypothetical protein
VRMVVGRAGGLTEERKADVRAGRKKNKATSVYSGDGLRNKEIFNGSFFIEQLDDDEGDSLGTLGDFKCNYCHALRWSNTPIHCTAMHSTTGGGTRLLPRCAATAARWSCPPTQSHRRS